MRNEPVNVFDPGHMSIDNIKSVYIEQWINAEKRHLDRKPGVERANLRADGAAGAPVKRFGGTRTAVYARSAPSWWYGGPPLQLASKYADEGDVTVFPELKDERPIKLPPAPVAVDPAYVLARDARTPDLRPGFVKRGVTEKLTSITHATHRAHTTAACGIGHNLPSEQGGLEYFPRRPEASEYAHGTALQLARGVRLRDSVEPPPIDPSLLAVKVKLVGGADAHIAGPAPRDSAAERAISEAVRLRMAAPPTGKITGERDLHGRELHERRSMSATTLAQDVSAAAGVATRLKQHAGAGSLISPPPQRSDASAPSTALSKDLAAVSQPVSHGRRESKPAVQSRPAVQLSATPAVELPKSRPMAHAGEVRTAHAGARSRPANRNCLEPNADFLSRTRTPPRLSIPPIRNYRTRGRRTDSARQRRATQWRWTQSTPSSTQTKTRPSPTRLGSRARRIRTTTKTLAPSTPSRTRTRTHAHRSTSATMTGRWDGVGSSETLTSQADVIMHILSRQ
jgi:hypothetical protein